MKKVIKPLSGVLVLTVLAACGSNGSSGDSNAEGNGDGNQEVSIDLGHGSAESNVRHEATVKFKEIVEEQSDGNMTVNIFPNEQLGSEPEMIENVALNELEIGLAGAGIFTQYDDRIGATELPYLFEDYEHAWEVLDGEAGDLVSEPLLDDNIRIVGFFENGMRQTTTSNNPVESPEDLNGVSIRTPEADVSVNTLEAMGASATPMAFGELYLALQQGTVDGQENPLANIYASSFYEVQDYVSLTNHQYGPLPMAISDEFWNSLSEDQQNIIDEAAEEAKQFHRETIRDEEEELLDELSENGMEIVEPETAPFEEATQPVKDNYADETSQEFMDEFLNHIEEGK